MVHDTQSKGQIALHSIVVIILAGSIAAQIVGATNVAFNKYDTAVTPPSVAFQIWAIIYLLTVALAIWQFFSNIYRSHTLDYAINALLMAVFILGGVWVYIFELDGLCPQFFLMVFYSLLISSASLLARYSPVHPFVRIVVDTHTSWILFAVTLSGFCYIKYSFWTPMDSPEPSFSIDQLHEVAYSLVFMFVVLLQGLLSIVCASFAFGLVSVWTCSWLTIKLFRAQPPIDIPSLKLSAGSGILISIGMTVLGGFLFDNKIYEQRKQSTKPNKKDSIHTNRAADKTDGLTNAQLTHKLISKNLVEPNPTPVIIETPSAPHSELSVLA